MTRSVLAIVVAGLTASASAQWLNYPTAGIPRLPDGKPDLDAPAPRAANGKPDLSGIWDIEHNRPCPPDGCDDMPIPQEFLNLGWSLKDGPPYQPWARELVANRMAENGKDDPASRCILPGVMKLYTTPFFRKIVQTPGFIAIIYERSVTYRQIFTDGRPLPEDPNPTWLGYSTAKWQGDTLVVETAGFRDDVWLDRNGSPLTEAGKIIERIRRPNFGRLEIDVTVDDPKAYTRPWTIRLNQNIVVDTELLDYVCQENEKDAPHLVGK